MEFVIGDEVVYPHHGASVIEGVETLSVAGSQRDYFVLRFDYADLTLHIPVDGTEAVGLRRVIGADEVEEVFAVLRKTDARTPSNWSRRFKNHTEMLRSGDVYQLAEVVRNLAHRKATSHLSSAEQRMLERARRALVSELSLAMGVDAEEAGNRLDSELE